MRGILPAFAVDPAGFRIGHSSATAPDFHRTSVSQAELFFPNIHPFGHKFKQDALSELAIQTECGYINPECCKALIPVENDPAQETNI